MRKLTYAQAINEGLSQALSLSPDVVLLGQLIDRKPGVFGTTLGLAEKHGTDRVQDFLVAESLMTSTGIGLALAGKRPVLIHHRLDFTIYAMDAITNWLSLWRMKSNGAVNLPVVIQAVIGKGWGQGPQHSKSLQSWFAHLPGLQVAMPATSYDAKGLLLEAIFGENPVLFLEPRSLFSMTNDVPEKPYRVRFGQAAIRRKGQDVTVVAIGNLLPLALRAADLLAQDGVTLEVIDPRTLSPMDIPTMCESVSRTGRLLVVDPAWKTAGLSAEIIARVTEQVFDKLKIAPQRVTFPDSHTPMSAVCEAHYYPDEFRIADAARALCKGKSVPA
jgi:acetoin:2,6-dichlorophenolindophenol oxidoreductase subunit beta